MMRNDSAKMSYEFETWKLFKESSDMLWMFSNCSNENKKKSRGFLSDRFTKTTWQFQRL